jgi:radical SAM-linked protein
MSETMQRWRLVFARDDEARFLSHLDAVHLWERAFRRGEVPVATSGGFSPRQRLVFAAPLPLGMVAEHELADLFLAEKLTRYDLRLRLADGIPRGYRLIDLHDEWVGGPAVATRLVAADYRMTLVGATPDRLDEAVRRLLAAASLRREKHREKKVTAYDLRPLLIDLQVRPVEGAGADVVEGAGAEVGEGLAGAASHEAASAAVGAGGTTATVGSANSAGLWMRLRNSQDQGSGRADEVVVALAEELGMVSAAPPGSGEGCSGIEVDEGGERGGSVERPSDGPVLEMVRPVRERLWIAGELPI